MMNKLLRTFPKKGEKNDRSRNWIWRQMLFLLMFFAAFSPTGLMAQVNPVIDGNPVDWNSANFNLFAVKKYQLDAFGNGVVDNQFTEGSKDFFPANQLVWSISQTKAKNDLANGAAIIRDGILYFAGDRVSNNGDAQIGFWLYLNGTGPTTISGQNSFSPPHADGDVLIIADFTGGGRDATVIIYQWDASGNGNVPNTNGNLRTTNLVGTVAENNNNQYLIPTGWTFPTATYDYNMFFEGRVDLNALGVLNLCNTSFLLETRSSQSITASLDDFISGGFNVTPTVTVNSPTVCTSALPATITATPGEPGVYNYAWTVPAGAANPGNVASFNATVPGVYSVILTRPGLNCPSEPGAGTLTVINTAAPTLGKVDPTCTVATGCVTVTSSTAGLTFSIDGGAYAAYPAGGWCGLAAGPHSVRAKNADGCISEPTQIVIPAQPPTPAAPTLGKVDPTCTVATGCVTVTSSTAGLTFSIDGGAYAAYPAGGWCGLAAGPHSVRAKNADGCISGPTQIVIPAQPPTPAAPTLGKVDPTCTVATGCVTVTSSTAGLTFSIDGGAYAAYPAGGWCGLAAGPHSVRAKNADGCISGPTQIVIPAQPPTPVVSCSASPNPIDITSAAHNTTLSASLAGSVDTDPNNYNYLWEITQGLGTLSSASAVSPVYTAAVGDAGGTVKFKVTVTHKTTRCFASSNCEVNVTAAGACPTVETTQVCNGSTNSYTASRPPTANETWVWSANNGASINAPNGQQTVSVTAGGQSFTLKLSVSYANPDLGTNECTYEVPVIACGGYCTYTQGKYSNRSPLCDGDGSGEGTAYTYPTVVDAIKAMLGVGGAPNPLIIGSNGKFITIPSTSSAAVLLNASMPGGGTASELFGSCTVDNVPSLPACWTPGTNSSATYITKQGKINNVLLSQTIALGLNLRVSGGLSSFALQAGTFATAATDGGCGSTTPKTRSCYYNELLQLVVVNEYLYKTIPVDIIDALNTKGYALTVGGLYQLANDALGNVDGTVGSEGGASLSTINNAVASINEGFDECRIFIGWDVEPCTVDIVSRRINLNPSGTIANPNAIITDKLNVSTYPNPFIDRVRFVIASPVSGQATLEVFDMMGRKLQTVYSGFITAGRNQMVEYKTSTNSNGTLIYKLRIGTNEVTGKLVNIRQ